MATRRSSQTTRLELAEMHARNWLDTSTLVAIWLLAHVITLFVLGVYFYCGLFTVHFFFT